MEEGQEKQIEARSVQSLRGRKAQKHLPEYFPSLAPSSYCVCYFSALVLMKDTGDHVPLWAASKYKRLGERCGRWRDWGRKRDGHLNPRRKASVLSGVRSRREDQHLENYYRQ